MWTSNNKLNLNPDITKFILMSEELQRVHRYLTQGKVVKVAYESGGIPLICFPIYKTENEKRKMTVFLLVFCKHLKGKSK